ncbi:hypothetical protein CVT24_008502 [Panaeolus cyanescens]|uniref:F-box domain-containing protein n=1 Tax=Panaeolus cyanescens TaxID=181874 RepID=A0A409W4L4_9AGAR|nr:hypothetical protein CVT24_008502 [Panaeolus cyanescens]
MDKFRTLEPVKLHAQKQGVRTSSQPQTHSHFVGRLPSDLHLLVLANLPVPDIPAYARSSRALSGFTRDDSVWKERWLSLNIHKEPALKKLIDELDKKSSQQLAASRAAAPPMINVEDEFGDFASAESANDAFGDFVNGTGNGNGLMNNGFGPTPRLQVDFPFNTVMKESFKAKYMKAHALLKPLTSFLSSPPHIVLTQIASQFSPSLQQEALLLRLLSFFLSPLVKPLRQWENHYHSLRSVMDRFDSNLLAAFDVADGNGDEKGMREAAEASWQVWDRSAGDWEMGKVWAEKREIFYQMDKWRALDNFTKDVTLDFGAMDTFIEDILKAIYEHGARAVRVFPPPSQVLIFFCERLANEVVGEYISTVLSRAREISNDIFLKSTAASFREAWRIVDAIMEVAKQREDADVKRQQAEDVIYQMFETNMDEYLDEEVESVKHAFDGICKGWDRGGNATSTSNQATFLASHNPALVKKTVLNSFTNLLLLPVTIVPRTVGAVGGVLMTGGSAAVQGIQMLNPQRWAGSGNVGRESHSNLGYSKKVDDAGMLFEVEEDDEDEDRNNLTQYPPIPAVEAKKPTQPQHQTRASTHSSDKPGPEQLDLLLSLDVALELIHADRESLKRVETFAGYPGHYGHRVRDTIEEIFILLLQALGERHVAKGFYQATERMKNYKPAEHAENADVAPLVQFFELVHIGDTIQSMVQVYFDKELAHHIDKTDFLNAVVREKKRFENSLDDSVAAGLNAGTDVLMNQVWTLLFLLILSVEHIILTLTKPREYYPPEDSPLELGPTKGCIQAIKCLETHCRLLKGSTSKEVLEVFYQEVGLRLIAILQKHIKRQIISLSGGFQVIADLNAYNAFVMSLKVPSITADFANLKMLGHVYIVEDAKDLAQIVRDVTRYGGAYRPEDIYEFIQRRSDWKKIEKVVDKTMYNLSFKEDCVIC